MKIGIWPNACRWTVVCCNFILIIFLQSCAHSAVTREAASQVDKGYINTVSSLDAASNSSIDDIYQNTNQATKGILLGSASGAIAGGLTTGVGILPGAAGGAILGGALGSYFDSYTTSVDQLENRHVKVLVLGDQIKLVIPSSQIFNGQTSTIMPSAYSTLNLVAETINSYKNMSVRVSVFSDSTIPLAIAYAFTREQANNVVKYLWRKGVNTRFLYGVGEGGTNLVSKSSLNSSDSLNYRIEISLESLPA